MHLVYIMHFSRIGMYKIGITSTEVRHDRIAAHERHGGKLVQVVEVPNREAAETVETFVLREVVLDFQANASKSDFPQGGNTETWWDDAPPVALEQIVQQLKSANSPGFDRLAKLQALFAKQPLTIAEIVRFRKIDKVVVDGQTIHVVGLSEPLEQVLRKTLAIRLQQSDLGEE
ncbi:hypothetical protein [Actinomadura luteofluorescens]|uniref:hypothetical protein n=1 Tax=Actinomadura luteofluorescens TaxID=46163 RepID=UPI003D904B89